MREEQRPRRALLATAAAALLCQACSGHAPRRAYGLPQIDFRLVGSTALPSARAPEAKLPQRVIVMPLWANQAPNPVGGLYDYTSYKVSPLYRTYFTSDIAVPLWESCASRLRARGLRVYKDYSDSSLAKRPAREARALVLSGELLGAVHDQLKHHFDRRLGHRTHGFQAARVEVQLTLTDLGGHTRWQRTVRVTLKVPDHPRLDLLEAAGHAVADQLIGDLALRDAITGDQGRRSTKGGAS